MYRFEQHIRVWIRFSGMERPMEISVPLDVLRYLDRHAEREVEADGAVVYYLPRHSRLPSVAFEPALSAGLAA